MSSLTECIARMGKLLTSEDRADLTWLYDGHIARGVGEAEASRLAVSDLMADMAETRRSIIEQVPDETVQRQPLYALGGRRDPDPNIASKEGFESEMTGTRRMKMVQDLVAACRG